MHSLIQLIYNSAATCTFTNEALAKLLRGARESNTKLGVTGMLLYVDGSFFQVLEGPQAAVDQVAEKIKQDPRHSKMTVIIREPIAHRSFHDWSMGFASLSTHETEKIEGLNDFFEEGCVLAQLDSGRAKSLLRAFSHGRWRVKLNAPVVAIPDAPSLVAPSPANTKKLAIGSDHPYSFAYQPIVNTRKRQVMAYEALVRGPGNKPAMSVLQSLSGPALWKFDRDARTQAIKLAAALGLPTKINLNLLPESLIALGGNAMFSTIDAATAHGLKPEQIVFEVSESETIKDFALFLDIANACRAMGAKFAIDDFGAGHSGLNLLADFQPDSLKIDMTLVRDIASKGPRQAIVRGILTTCADLGIQVVAEGVETLDEFCWLRDEGIELFQGYLFAKPLFEGFPEVHYPQVRNLSHPTPNTASSPQDFSANLPEHLSRPSC